MHEVATWKYTWVCYLVEPYVVSIILRVYNVGYLSWPEVTDVEPPNKVINEALPNRGILEILQASEKINIPALAETAVDKSAELAHTLKNEVKTDVPADRDQSWKQQGSTYDDTRVFAAESQTQISKHSGELKPDKPAESNESSQHTGANKAEHNEQREAPSAVKNSAVRAEERAMLLAAEWVQSLDPTPQSKQPVLVVDAGAVSPKNVFDDPNKDHMGRPLERYTPTSFQWPDGSSADKQPEINKLEAERAPKFEHRKETRDLLILEGKKANESLEFKQHREASNAASKLNPRILAAENPDVAGQDKDVLKAAWQDKVRHNLVIDKAVFFPKDGTAADLCSRLTVSDDISHKDFKLVEPEMRQAIREAHTKMFYDSAAAVDRGVSNNPADFRPCTITKDKDTGAVTSIVFEPKMSDSEVLENNQRVIAHLAGREQRCQDILNRHVVK